MILVEDKNILTFSPQYLQKDVFEKLQKVAQKHEIILYEGYRSLEKQAKMFNEFKASHPDMPDGECHKFVAMPAKAIHVTGGAVDISLKGKNMGTGYLCFDGSQKTDFFINNEVANNRKLLCSIMEEEGFVNFYNEWWHFEYGTAMWARLTGNSQIYFNKSGEKNE